MKFITIFLLLGAMALPASASAVDSWTQVDIAGHNLTLNYTSSFNVLKNDTLGISIKNVGNESLNDTITINEISVSDTSEAEGTWTGHVIVTPNSSETIDFPLNVTTDEATTVDIIIYYNVSSDSKTLSVTAHYPGTVEPPAITSWGNSKTNNNSTTLTVNTSEVVAFNATADQTINTWNWSRENVRQNNDYNNLSISWDASGTKTLSVNATNANGTSNTVIWTVIVQAPAGVPAPSITSWSNNKTDNNDLTLIINTSETVKFNFTANQTLTSWLWILNGNSLANPSDTFTYKFNSKGLYRVAANGSNANGTTQTIVWNVTVQEREGKKNASFLSWSPEVVDYVYVNDTVSETIEYSITTVEPMIVSNWSVDGVPVSGSVSDSTYSYTHTWDNESVGFHTVIYKGSNADSQIEFRWYVNVYEIGGYRGGNLFDVIDDALENHVTDIKVRMFKYKIAKHGGNAAITAQKVNQLHDEIAKRQMTREALRKEFMAGNITVREYAAALKQVQRDAKYNMKLAKDMEKIAKEELKDENSSEEFKKISEMENDRGNDKKKIDRTKGKSKGKNKDKGTKKKGYGSED